jgi:5-methylcytosine-specific restriction enzyme subunit McrC
MLIVGEQSTDISVRSLWFLLIYASNMLNELTSRERESLLAGDRDAHLIDAIAEVLVAEVERRLRQRLSFHYQRQEADLTRVRGRINHLRTTSNRLLEQGRIACRFDQLTVDSPRNRFVAATLRSASHIVSESRNDLKQRCRSAAFRMERMGVGAQAPTRAQLSKDRMSHHDSADRRMLDAAHLVDAMALPFHQLGPRVAPKIIRDEGRYRKLFQDAVFGYFTHKHHDSGWTTKRPHLKWQVQNQATCNLLPRMETDVVLENQISKKRVIVEVKFTDLFSPGRWDSSNTIKSGYLYQLYAYLMSQHGVGDGMSESAEGVLLFVAANGREAIDQSVEIQGHRLRFLSVDLSATPAEIRKRWDSIVDTS